MEGTAGGLRPLAVRVCPIRQMAGEQTEDNAVGRTRGGLNTKLHAIVDGLGNSVKSLLSAGNDNDCVHAIELLENVEFCGSNVLADRA